MGKPLVGTLVELGLDSRLGMELSGLGSVMGMGSVMGSTSASPFSWTRLGKQQHRCRTTTQTVVGSCRWSQSLVFGRRIVEPSRQHGTSVLRRIRHKPSGLDYKPSGTTGLRQQQQQQLPRHKQ